jgi:hypothetical protein
MVREGYRMESMHSRKDAKNTSGELNVIFRTFLKKHHQIGAFTAAWGQNADAEHSPRVEIPSA